jgi:hypothetical protein
MTPIGKLPGRMICRNIRCEDTLLWTSHITPNQDAD